MISLKQMADFIKMCVTGDWDVNWNLICDLDNDDMWITIDLFLGDLVSGVDDAFTLKIDIMQVNQNVTKVMLAGFSLHDISSDLRADEYSLETMGEFYAWLALSSYQGGVEVQSKVWRQMNLDFEMNKIGKLDTLGHDAMMARLRKVYEDAKG